ncbi:hypothetical protein T05_13032 [Trichinella murrelli]|uniref:Uncharacterized protein n=1 Tax=Trichinella murrelli TaxID=144512 RepID=A0A0V0THQ5_9BILA|nr:hypothetical protein T05_13032 [Trichinella murrelli]
MLIRRNSIFEQSEDFRELLQRTSTVGAFARILCNLSLLLSINPVYPLNSPTELEEFIKPVMTFTRFSVEPIMPTFQVVIRPNIYIMYISKPQSFIVLCVPELFESFSILFLVMADVPELHLVPNRCGIWSNSVVWLWDAVWTDLEVPAGIDRKDHVETCRVDEHMAYID